MRETSAEGREVRTAAGGRGKTVSEAQVIRKGAEFELEGNVVKRGSTCAECVGCGRSAFGSDGFRRNQHFIGP